MRRPYNLPDFIGALLFMAIGIVVSLEANRLRAYSLSPYVGDHTLPTVLGILFVLLGGILLVQSYRTKARVKSFPSPERSRLLGCLALLLLYWWLLEVFGYLLATALVSFALFRLIGSYRLATSAFFGILLTGSMHLVFVLWLQITFPTGYFF